MLPKILRMRRELVLSPLVVFRGASIALVAICFPALCEERPEALPLTCRYSGEWWSAARYPLQCLRSVRRSDPVPERTGKAPGARHRAAEPSFVGFGRYNPIPAACKPGVAQKQDGAPGWTPRR